MMDRVTALLLEAAAEDVLPRYRSLSDAERFEKQGGEIVTAADHAVEARLRAGLADIRPDAAFVGEESAAADPGSLAALSRPGAVWVVDPVDGTNNFANGRRHFCIMVALVEDGDTVAAWVHDPLDGWTASANRGAGAFIDAMPSRMPVPPDDVADWKGGVSTRFLPPAMRGPAKAGAARMAHSRSTFCAGHDYVAMLRGERQLALYYRTHPWDHAPGALLVSEAGGVVRRFDGSPYRPGTDGVSLLAAADKATWRRARDLLLAGDGDSS
jgi:fructose-1,6-bisphosphatase/inositol monophosphatase family enzyme